MNDDLAISLLTVNKTYKVRTSGNETIREKFYNCFKLKKQNLKNIKALKNINLNIYVGESIGIIGRNGSGKSTLINIIMQTIRPDKGGEVFTSGKIMRLSLGLGIDPNLTARDNIYVNGSVIGLTFNKISSIFADVIKFAGLEDFIDTPIKFYSKGMKQRLMFSIAMHAQADIFLLDEFFGGTGDKEFRQKSNEAFQKRIIENKTNVIVSHSLNTIKKHCQRAIWIDKGEIIMEGKVNNVIKEYESQINAHN